MKNVIEKLFSGIFDCLVYLFCCLIEFLSTRPLLTCKFLLLSPFHQIQRLFSLHRTHWEQTVFYKYY